MKNKIILIILSICVSPFVFSQHDCNMYYPLKDGATFQITTYDKKDKATSVLDYKVLNVSDTPDGKVGTIHGVVKDKKGKMVTEMEYKVRCKDNKISVDFNSLMSPQMLEQFKDMEIDVTGTNLDWPNDLRAGQTLPDANMKMKISMAGMNMNFSIDITDRKVIGAESVTTPAGTFDCMVITFDTQVNMGIKQTTSSKQWVSKDVGMVKQEDYKNGKIIDTSLLTAFSI